MTNNGEVQTAIVLQGGGALGAYECGVLQALYDSRGRAFKPAVITGISIGAVNAAVLGGAGIDALAELWHRRLALPQSPWDAIGEILPEYTRLVPPAMQQFLAVACATTAALQNCSQPFYARNLSAAVQHNLSLLGNAGMYRPRAEYLATGPAAALFTDSVYDTAPLRETLRDVLGNMDRLNHESEVVVTAVNVATGEAAQFGNTKAIQAHKRNGSNPFANTIGLTIDHIVASGSLPPSFPATKIDGSSYWDGGVYINTPLSIAINCLENLGNCSNHVKREVIVVELFPMAGDVPACLNDVVSRFFNLVYSSKLASIRSSSRRRTAISASPRRSATCFVPFKAMQC